MLNFQGVNHYLGEFKDIEDAKKTRRLYEQKYYEPIIERYSME